MGYISARAVRSEAPRELPRERVRACVYGKSSPGGRENRWVAGEREPGERETERGAGGEFKGIDGARRGSGVRIEGSLEDGGRLVSDGCRNVLIDDCL